MHTFCSWVVTSFLCQQTKFSPLRQRKVCNHCSTKISIQRNFSYGSQNYRIVGLTRWNTKYREIQKVCGWGVYSSHFFRLKTCFTVTCFCRLKKYHAIKVSLLLISNILLKEQLSLFLLQSFVVINKKDGEIQHWKEAEIDLKETLSCKSKVHTEWYTQNGTHRMIRRYTQNDTSTSSKSDKKWKAPCNHQKEAESWMIRLFRP